MDASGLGTKVKDGKNQKTILSSNEINLIQECFINKEEKKNLSVITTIEEIRKHNYALSAGHFFKTEIDYVNISDVEFKTLIDTYKNNLTYYFSKRKESDEDILKVLEDINNA